MNCNSNTVPLINEDENKCIISCEPKIINVICREIIIPLGQKTLAVEGDINSTYREFLVPIETEQGFSLSDAKFEIIIKNSDNNISQVEIEGENKTIIGNYIKLKWNLTLENTSIPGDLIVSIVATKDNFKWETYPATFNIYPSIKGVNANISL